MYVVAVVWSARKVVADKSQDDDGFIIYESRAIARYIEAKYPGKGTKLAPAADDLKALGLFEQAYSVEISNFNPHVSGAVFEKLFKPCVVLSLRFTPMS